MRKYLLPENGSFYKANLHCHTNLSDGKLSPETMKGAYMAHGYSIIAYTDHDILIPHHDLTDSRFLALTGMELEVSEPAEIAIHENRTKKTCHMCLIALDPDNVTTICYHREKYMVGNGRNMRDRLTIDESKPDYVRVYSVEGVSEMMKMGRDAGFFVTYNHPGWSHETFEQYGHYEGMHAMEICNYSCYMKGFADYNPKVYDEILRTGKRIFCIGADDNHNGHPLTDPLCDSFGAYTMIKAEALEYRAVTAALMAGSFYASQGPEIFDLWYEDGYVHITCSPARKIYMATGKRRSLAKIANRGETITEASFPIETDCRYIRLAVEDTEGRCANTNAYFLDEFIDGE